MTYTLDVGATPGTQTVSLSSAFATDDALCPVITRVLVMDNDGTDTSVPANVADNFALDPASNTDLVLTGTDLGDFTFYVKGTSAGGQSGYV